MRKINLLNDKKAVIGKLFVYFLLTIMIVVIVGAFLVLASFKAATNFYKPETSSAITQSEALMTLQSLLETKVTTTIDSQPFEGTISDLMSYVCFVKPYPKDEEFKNHIKDILDKTYSGQATYWLFVRGGGCLYSIDIHSDGYSKKEVISMPFPLPDGSTAELNFGITKTAK